MSIKRSEALGAGELGSKSKSASLNPSPGVVTGPQMLEVHVTAIPTESAYTRHYGRPSRTGRRGRASGGARPEFISTECCVFLGCEELSVSLPGKNEAFTKEGMAQMFVDRPPLN